MQRRSLIPLAAVTLVMVAVAVAALATGGEGVSRAGPDQRALPGLAGELAQVASVAVERRGLDLTFQRAGNNWLVAQKGNYPADSAKIRRIVLALADLTLVEPKTHEPRLYPRLEVGDPGTGSSTLVTLRNKSAAVLARLIVGKRSFDRLGEGSDGVYVRKPGDPQSWLARGSLDFSDDMANWLDRDIVDIPNKDIAKVSLTQPDGTTLVLSRAAPDAKFVVIGAPPNAKYKDETALGEPAMALETLDLDDVAPAATLAVPDKGVTGATFTCFDGMTIAVKLFQHANRNWIALAATGSGKTAAAAKTIDHRVGGWVYQIPSYKAKMMQTRLADLLAPPKGS
ncbi:MAG TPA: DUF4340 domain-containing protein [Stellaceae bacterium]|nr:DUF4340 domain-containing protein [Stellaceae bacterium]